MTVPLVSVLLTAFNRESYLAASIESVLAQTWGDFELIVVDDRSTDGTIDIARRYERLDSRVRVVLNDRNYGQFANRNHAASLATAPFLKFHDSDDLMYPHCLGVMVPALRGEPRAGFGLSSSRAWPGGAVPMLLTPRQSYQREFLGFGLFMCGPAAALFRTDVFRDLGGFEDYGTRRTRSSGYVRAPAIPCSCCPAISFTTANIRDRHFRRPTSPASTQW